MKQRIIALLLVMFFGFIGLHDFYLNRNIAGHNREIIFVASFVFLFGRLNFLEFLAL